LKNLIAVSCFFISLSAFASELTPVKFLTGCWSTKDEAGNKISEVWQAPKVNDMEGLSKTVSPDGSVLNQESLSMKWLSETRRIQYQAAINGELMAPFLLDQNLSVTSKKAVFTNPINDFPKSISYELSSPDTLSIRLVGNDENGAPFEIAYELGRELCE
jgi:hypothetical protein